MKINMKKIKNCILLLICFSNVYLSNAQVIKEIDSVFSPKTDIRDFQYKKLIIPSAFILYGVIALGNNNLKAFNTGISSDIRSNIDKKTTIDDFTLFAPAASVYVINALGVKGKNNLRDRSIILATSTLIMATTVFTTKSLVKAERPDMSDFQSFPSGHTAGAFAGAEFLWQEYKDVSIWYGISGFIVASGTGIFRISNNKHNFSDVIAGAGIGILSTKIAYWIFPTVNKYIFGKSNNKKYNSQNNNTGMIAPFYNGKEAGVGMIYNFK